LGEYPSLCVRNMHAVQEFGHEHGAQVALAIDRGDCSSFENAGTHVTGTASAAPKRGFA